jgi:hypothetical protein
MSQDPATPAMPTPRDSGPVGTPETDPETWGAPPPGFVRRPAPDGAEAGWASEGFDPSATTPTTPTTSPFPGEPLDDGWDGDLSPRRPLRIAKTLEPFLTDAVIAAGELLNARARDVGAHPDQWRTDANDVTVAEPLARVADRYMPATALGDPTVKDLLEAALITMRYLVKQLHLALAWRRERRGAPPATPQPMPAA